MQKIHEKLLQDSPSYQKWHENPSRTLHHFIVFIATAVLFTYASLNSIQSLAFTYDNMSVQTANLYENGSSNLPNLTTKLLQEVKKYQSANDKGKGPALNNLIKIAETRKTAMLNAVKTNPKSFLSSAIPNGLFKKLPAEVVYLIEQETSVEGKMDVLHIDYPDETQNEFVYFVEDAENERYAMHFAKDKPEHLFTGDRVKVKGFVMDKNIVIDDAARSVTNSTGDSALTSGPTGEQRTIAIMISFTDKPATAWTPAQAAAMLFTNTNSVNAYYKDSSFNKTAFSGDVVGWYSLPMPTGTTCDYYSWAYAAENAATAAGVNLANYNRKVFVLPGTMPGCGWTGISNVGGNPSRSWVTNISSSLSAHELGHALGMRHASSYSCGTQAISTTGCTIGEYGDPYDVMGNSYAMFSQNAPHKIQQTWVPTSNVQTVSTSGTYTIYPLQILSSNIQALKIYKPDTGENYYVEYRRPLGFDSGLPASVINGTGIRLWTTSTTKLIDTTPGDGTFANSYLADGRSFTDLANGITITQVSHDDTSATLQVTYGPGVCVKAKPTVSVSPLSQQGTAGSVLNYNVSVTNKDSLACPTSAFNINLTNLPTGFSYVGKSLSIAPASSAATQIPVTSPVGTPDSSNLFTVTVVDPLDATHSNTAQATYVTFTDLVGPTVAITSPVNGSTIGKGASLNITATATDTMGVTKVEIYVDSKLVATDTTSPYTYKWNTKGITAGNHIISAKAYDPSGNSSTASVTVRK